MTSKELLITDRKAVIEAAGRKEKDVKADIDIIKDWLKTQPHLPEVPNDNMIEHFLVTNKFSIERTKQRLDMYYTIRTLIPEFYVDRNPLSPKMQDINKMGIFVPLPKLTKELYRVYIMKIEGQPEDFDTYKYFANALNIIEMRVQYDLSLGDIYIIDYTNLKMGHVVKMTPTHFKKAITVSEKVFSNRIKGIHLVYSPSYIDTLMNIGKALLKPKIFGRIHNHANIEEIYKFIPKEVLPTNYGGEERSIEELNVLWKSFLKANADRFNKLEEMKVKEELRPTPLQNDEILGFHGNFKKLDVD